MLVLCSVCCPAVVSHAFLKGGDVPISKRFHERWYVVERWWL